ncbi:hypothetical protein A2U01_0031593, partial [Trifolium medium]|nr:hypothetical protein [Trifolium medium]
MGKERILMKGRGREGSGGGGDDGGGGRKIMPLTESQR